MSDEAQSRKLIAERARLISAKDATAALQHYADDVVNFDLAPPLALRGPEATDPAKAQAWCDTWDGPIGLAFDQLEIRISGALSVAFGFLHLTGKRTDGSETDVWARLTLCLERRGGAWKIVHEHQSFPTRMDGSGTSASDLKP
jgi:ketosteroid isomerase-like protein